MSGFDDVVVGSNEFISGPVIHDAVGALTDFAVALGLF